MNLETPELRRAMLSFSLMGLLGTVLAMPLAAHARNPRWEEFDLSSGSKREHPTSTRFADFNSGWTSTFDELKGKISADRDYVTWIISEPKTVMDLRTAETFRSSFVMHAKSDDSTISHMMIAWSCHDRNGRRLVGGAAQTGEDSEQSEKMMMRGWGMTPIYAIFHDGHLDTAKDIGAMLRGTSKYHLKVAHVTFEIPRENCQRMLEFLKAYLEHPRKPFTRFGLNLDPLKFEGGGCGSFASAMLTKAGVLADVQPLLKRELRGTRYLMGLGLGELPEAVEIDLPPEYAGRTNYVWPGDLQLYRWTMNDGPPIRLVDPELGILALRQFGLFFAHHTKLGKDRLEQTGFGLRMIKGETAGPIDENLDEQAARVVQSTRKQIGFFSQSGMKTTPLLIGKHWGLLVAH